MDAQQLRQGAPVVARDGTLGRLRHVIVAPDTREVTELVVVDDGTEWLVPASAIAEATNEQITLSGRRADYQQDASFDRDAYHVVEEDEVREETARRAERGGEPVLDAREDEVTIGQGRPERAAPAAAADAGYRLQLREERLRVATERERAGEVQLGKRVVERTETAEVPLREERVVIERRPGSGEVVGGEIIGEDESVAVDVTRERPVVEKEVVVAEEVDVRTETVQRTERVEATLRREELAVEEQGDVNVTGETRTSRTTDEDGGRR